jgi:acetyltransferase-like isoleucine patch superfamily enzyme
MRDGDSSLRSSVAGVSIADLRHLLRRSLGKAVRTIHNLSAEVGIVGPDDDLARGFGAFGSGSALLFPQGVIYNESYIQIGEGTMVGPGVCLTAGMGPEQTMLTNPVVSIGDRCVIGRGSHVIGHWSIQLGDDIQTGPYVYITDQNHGYEDPTMPVGIQPTKEAAVRIGSGSWLGANAVILPGAVLGRNCVVAAGAVVRGSFPDSCVIAGVPAKIVRIYEGGEWHRPT